MEALQMNKDKLEKLPQVADARERPQPINPIENNACMVIGQHVVDQFPWGHNILTSWFPSSSLGTRFEQEAGAFKTAFPSWRLGTSAKHFVFFVPFVVKQKSE